MLSPAELYQDVTDTYTKKIQGDLLQNIVLGLFGGAYVALGALGYTISTTGTPEALGLGASKVLGGIIFSLGLILVILAGAQLFTGNTLIWGASLRKQVSPKDMLINWVWVYTTNFLGALLVVAIVYFAGIYGYPDALSHYGETALKVAQGKVNLTGLEIFMRGILANWLVCLAVYLAYTGKNTTEKILGIIFPITVFVAVGLEHSVANMFFLPIGYLLQNPLSPISLTSLGHNFLFSTLGNIVGGGFFVATLYFLAFRKQLPSSQK